ncbi:hypothetical protein A3C32_03520 [Candidatus Daviesbacteria bacterium RIFCSPHIGHO2_02_FULL_41_14]|uniref:Uncharacterized protein n=1 Tax=Candidatus Daviesbacteria bacterium RIFCSPLOWO2_01_FULL_40_24 TaxID=1797787 RepID=A0A1F5MJR1_9BACT|nr:MAG: hypothetical protein A3C32_03520 [Candidatus Daviesbacteria bacterium RIFCSPHIGHO2_02_FULL_41_14]OGE65583.1 MAG: hypothetical protein A3B49_02100 [Candidatus Daviesbacteria bacterium RIFCSPLOWO2_01_FULL_40_24]
MNELRECRDLGELLAKCPPNWPPKSIDGYKYNPYTLWDKSPMRRILRPLMLLRANGKVSHWWTYQRLPDQVTPEGLVILGDQNVSSFTDRDPIQRKRAHLEMSLGVWNTAYYLFPNWDLMTPEQIQSGWRYGYSSLDSRIKEYSNIINQYEMLALCGRDDFKVFGIESHSFREIPIIAIKSPKGRRTQSPIT